MVEGLRARANAWARAILANAWARANARARAWTTGRMLGLMRLELEIPMSHILLILVFCTTYICGLGLGLGLMLELGPELGLELPTYVTDHVFGMLHYHVHSKLSYSTRYTCTTP